jgi:hypothetical protein
MVVDLPLSLQWWDPTPPDWGQEIKPRIV